MWTTSASLKRMRAFAGCSAVSSLIDLTRQERRKIEKRWRKEKHRSVPSPSAVFRYLAAFHEDCAHIEGKAVIPPLTELLYALERINADLVASIQKTNPLDTATLDMDATLIGTQKKEALLSYQGYKAYQPLNTYWAEQGLVLHTEFRDGNVPAGHEQLRVFVHALSLLPEGIKTVRLRSDTAGYQHDLLRYCDNKEKHPRFGRIEFAIGADVTPEFKKAVCETGEWHTLFARRDASHSESGRKFVLSRARAPRQRKESRTGTSPSGNG